MTAATTAQHSLHIEYIAIDELRPDPANHPLPRRLRQADAVWPEVRGVCHRRRACLASPAPRDGVMSGGQRSDALYVLIRCPHCGRLVAEAAPQSAVRVKCGRCKAMVHWPERAPRADGQAGKLVN
jgi:phage FluMu protein Com